MSMPAQGTLERLLIDKMIEMDEKGRGVTYLDFVGTEITEENIDQIVNNLRNAMYVAEDDSALKFDA